MKNKKESAKRAAAAQLRTAEPMPFGAISRISPLGGTDLSMYEAMREAVPILDAAIGKLVRLVGGFTVSCADKNTQNRLTEFLRTVPIGRGQFGIDGFLQGYLDCLLTYGRAIGEIAVDTEGIRAVCWGDVKNIHVKEGAHPLDFKLGVYEGGKLRILPYQNLLLFSTWNPTPAHPYGVSLLASMPFLTDVLLKIYKTIGTNWERAGNVRYSVIYKPENGEMAADAAEQMANEWSQAMRRSTSGEVRDFVAVGDVQIKVIGADGQILDSEVPVRQILEQLVAKTGLPPFLLGLSWASTERMSAQQTDLLTSELWAIRRTVQPILEKICRTWLAFEGLGGSAEIVWNDISLQDIEAEAHAKLYTMQAEKLRMEMEEGL